MHNTYNTVSTRHSQRTNRAKFISHSTDISVCRGKMGGRNHLHHLEYLISLLDSLFDHSVSVTRTVKQIDSTMCSARRSLLYFALAAAKQNITKKVVISGVFLLFIRLTLSPFGLDDLSCPTKYHPDRTSKGTRKYHVFAVIECSSTTCPENFSPQRIVSEIPTL
jgi:hypothetical protein